MQRDAFHNQYTNQELLYILHNECDDRGLPYPDVNSTQRCSIAAALEQIGVEFEV